MSEERELLRLNRAFRALSSSQAMMRAEDESGYLAEGLPRRRRGPRPRAEAVAIALALRPDVVIMDVSMPRLNGIDATRQIVAERPGMRIIGQSMHEDETIAASMPEAGAVDFVTKGGPPDALLSAICAACRPESTGGRE